MKDEIPCAQCGKIHLRNAMELSFKRPDAVVALSKEQRKAEVRESDDLCTIRADHFFVRGVLPLTVDGWDTPYRIGVWVEVERATFDRIRDLWGAPDQHKEPAFSATLANDIPSFPSTVGMLVELQLIGPTSRPDVLVPGSDHPLHREQCQGITSHRANEYSSYF